MPVGSPSQRRGCGSDWGRRWVDVEIQIPGVGIAGQGDEVLIVEQRHVEWHSFEHHRLAGRAERHQRVQVELRSTLEILVGHRLGTAQPVDRDHLRRAAVVGHEQHRLITDLERDHVERLAIANVHDRAGRDLGTIGEFVERNEDDRAAGVGGDELRLPVDLLHRHRPDRVPGSRTGRGRCGTSRRRSRSACRRTGRRSVEGTIGNCRRQHRRRTTHPRSTPGP